MDDSLATPDGHPLHAMTFDQVVGRGPNAYADRHIHLPDGLQIEARLNKGCPRESFCRTTWVNFGRRFRKCTTLDGAQPQPARQGTNKDERNET